jgi:hypothetical protein
MLPPSRAAFSPSYKMASRFFSPSRRNSFDFEYFVHPKIQRA